MARVTVEDCLEKVPNRFALVILGAERARQLAAGARAAGPLRQQAGGDLAAGDRAGPRPLQRGGGTDRPPVPGRGAQPRRRRPPVRGRRPVAPALTSHLARTSLPRGRQVELQVVALGETGRHRVVGRQAHPLTTSAGTRAFAALGQRPLDVGGRQLARRWWRTRAARPARARAGRPPPGCPDRGSPRRACPRPGVREGRRIADHEVELPVP